MSTKFVIQFFTGILLSTIAGFSFSQNLRIVTENFPPFHYIEDEKIKGSTIDLLSPILPKYGLVAEDIEIYPWARTYKLALETPNTLIFSLVRFPAREDLFKWVAPVGFIKIGIFKLKSRTDIKIDKVADIDKYFSAVFIDSAIQHFYEQEQFQNYETLGDFDSLAKMLMRGRVDIVPASTHGFLSRASAMGFDLNDIEVVYYIKDLEKGLWAAFNKETDDALVEELRLAIENETKKNELLSLPIKAE